MDKQAMAGVAVQDHPAGMLASFSAPISSLAPRRAMVRSSDRGGWLDPHVRA
jgi:hypothetical protein